MKTIFCDIDGTILKHQGQLSNITIDQELIEGTLDKLNEWFNSNYTIILTTARPESMRPLTIDQMSKYNINYDLLIMGLPTGERIIINDISGQGINRASAINLLRNNGIKDLKI